MRCLNLVLGVFILVMIAGFASAASLSECGMLNVKGETYFLNSDVSSAGTCFNVAADDVVLNCNGHKVTYSKTLAGNGIISNGYDRTVVRNCVFVQSSKNSNSDAVRLENSNDNVVVDNQMVTVGDFSLGVWIEKSSGNSIANNKIITQGNNSSGLANYVASGDNVVLNNEIFTAGSMGISIFDGGDNQIGENFYNGNKIDIYVRDGTVEKYDLSNALLLVEDPNYGLIKFSEPITASGADLSKDVKISFNLANIKEGSEFESSNAEIILYNTDSLGLAKKEPWRNNVLCPDSICAELSNKDKYRFNVTMYGRYSVGYSNGTDEDDSDWDYEQNESDDEDEAFNFCKETPMVVEGSYKPGYSKSTSKKVLPIRMNVSKIQKIENDNTYNFLTLGFGGEVIIEYPVNNENGNDFRIVETSFNQNICNKYPEMVSVDASKDMVNWVHLGEGCLDSNFDLGSLDYALYFRMKDITDPTKFGYGNDVDGYDIDGVTCAEGAGEDINTIPIVIIPPTEAVPQKDYYAEFQIIGASLTRGIWYQMPVTVKIHLGNEVFEPWGSYADPVNANVNDGNNPRIFSGANKFSAGTPMSIDAKAWKKRKLYDNGKNNEHWMVFSEASSVERTGAVKILKNGDAVPITKGGAFDQASVNDYLDSFISSDGKIKLGSNQVIYLFELGEANYNSAAADFQDLVVLATLSKTPMIASESVQESKGTSLTGYLIQNAGENNATSIGALLVLAAIVYIFVVIFKKILSSK